MPETRGCPGARAAWGGEVTCGGYVLGRPDPKRARQFMPFAALRGYYELVHQTERVPERRRDLSQEDRERLSRKLACLRKGSMATVTFYDGDAYVSVTGVVARIDPEAQALTVVKRVIAYADLLDIQSEDIPDEYPWQD